MLVGYASVSTQVQALIAAGCERVFAEKASGSQWDRPELQNALITCAEAIHW